MTLEKTAIDPTLHNAYELIKLMLQTAEVKPLWEAP